MRAIGPTADDVSRESQLAAVERMLRPSDTHPKRSRWRS
jgi:hypothetical protein